MIGKATYGFPEILSLKDINYTKGFESPDNW
jgi:hypothetical protein